MPWKKVNPIWKPEAIGLCGYPYYGHRHGCSNFCKRPGCPPTMAPLNICLDDCYFVYIFFPIRKHVKRMLRLHPEWSVYQAQNIYYWQAKARRMVDQELETFLSKRPNYVALKRGIHLDSWGIDVTATLAAVGVEMLWADPRCPDDQWGLRQTTCKVRFAGYPLRKASAARMRKLRQRWPNVYQARNRGRCATCRYRPCLRLLAHNAAYYVHHTIGDVTIQRLSPSGRRFVVRCNVCGRTHTVATSKLCTVTTCQRKAKGPSG